MRDVAALPERVITLASDTEDASVVHHRLFERLDHPAANASADAYRVYYGEVAERGGDIPERVLWAVTVR